MLKPLKKLCGSSIMPIGNLARKEYEKYRGSSSTPIFSSPQIISGNIDNLINSPAVERLVQSLAKLYIENKGMK